MFKIDELRKANRGLLIALIEEEESGKKSSRNVIAALKRFSEVWGSEGCKHYRECFGKLALNVEMRQRGSGNVQMFENYKSVLGYGHKIDLYGRNEMIYGELFDDVVFLDGELQVMEVNQEELDKFYAGK